MAIINLGYIFDQNCIHLFGSISNFKIFYSSKESFLNLFIFNVVSGKYLKTIYVDNSSYSVNICLNMLGNSVFNYI